MNDVLIFYFFKLFKSWATKKYDYSVARMSAKHMQRVRGFGDPIKALMVR